MSIIGIGPETGGFADYDSANLTVDTQQLAVSATNLKNLSQNVADSITQIQNTLSNLALSWAGTTQAEADALTTQWNTVMTGLFGTQDGTVFGVLNVLASGTQAVAAGFAQTEVSLQNMFVQFSTGMNTPSADGDTTPTSSPAPVTDTSTTAVTETW